MVHAACSCECVQLQCTLAQSSSPLYACQWVHLWVHQNVVNCNLYTLHEHSAKKRGCTAAGDLPAGDRLVIGLNPPFGKNNGLANMFVAQAASFRPRVIVLIVPPAVSTPGGYRVMYEEQETMKDKCAPFLHVSLCVICFGSFGCAPEQNASSGLTVSFSNSSADHQGVLLTSRSKGKNGCSHACSLQCCMSCTN